MEWSFSEQLLHCICEALNVEDVSGWAGHPEISQSAHCTASHYSTVSAPSVSSTSGMTHTHHSSTSHNSGKSNSKHHLTRVTTSHEVPDIPFKMSEIHSSPQLLRLDNHTAHVEHYLSCYTYPNLEHALLASIPAHTRVLCSCCADAIRSYGNMDGQREGLVRPSVVQVLLKDSVHDHKLRSVQNFSMPRVQRSTHTLRGIHGTSSTDPQLGLSSSSHSRSNSDTHNTTTCISTALVPLSRQRKYDNITCSNSPSSTKRRAAGSYDMARHVYDMGVRWNPNNFPSFIVSSVDSASRHKPTHAIGRTANTKRSTNSHTSLSSSPNHTESKNGRISAQMLNMPQHVRGKKRRVRGSAESAQDVEKHTLSSSKTLSSFSIITPSHKGLTNTQTSAKMPPIRSQTQGLVTAQRDLTHLLRQRKSVSFRSGKNSSFRYESLCLEGRSATINTGLEEGDECGDVNSDPVTVRLSSGGSRPPVTIAGPWIN